MDFDSVGRLVTCLDIATLKFIGERRKIHELLTTSSTVGSQSGGLGMLIWIGGIQRMKGGRVDRVTGNMLPPIIKRHAPRVGAVISPKTGQPLRVGMKTKPSTVSLTNGAVSGFDLRVMENRFAKNHVSAGRPNEIVQRVVRVFRAKPTEDFSTHVGFAVAICVFQKRQMWLFGNVNTAIAELE